MCGEAALLKDVGDVPFVNVLNITHLSDRFKRVSYTIEAVLLDQQSGGASASSAEGRGVCSNNDGASSRLAASAEHVREVEAKLLQRKEEIRAFETEYRQVKAASVRCILFASEISSSQMK